MSIAAVPYMFHCENVVGWKAYLQAHGFVVLTDVLTDEDVERGNVLFSQKYPTQSPPVVDENGFIHDTTFTFSKFAWFTRAHPSVLSAYQQLYNDGDLVTSFDRGNAQNGAHGEGDYWLHVDYPLFDSRYGGAIYYQSFVSYTTSYGLRVVDGSHLKLDQTREHTKWQGGPRDTFYPITAEYVDRVCVDSVNILAPAGSLTLWDSRTLHDGDDSIVTQRRCVYLCYVPMTWMTRAEKSIRKKIFERGQTTTHWPVRYIGLHYEEEASKEVWDHAAMVKKYPVIKTLIPL